MPLYWKCTGVDLQSEALANVLTKIETDRHSGFLMSGSGSLVYVDHPQVRLYTTTVNLPTFVFYSDSNCVHATAASYRPSILIVIRTS
jgi:hypothetical protein